MKSYIFNLETTKIELHFEKSEYNALTDEQKGDLKSAFLWSRTGSCWVSRAKEPNLWRAKQVAAKLGFSGEQREGERISFSEQVERQAERAENRAERYEQYATNAEQRGKSLQKPIESMRGDIAFFTQPILTGHSGSQAFARRRERMYAQYARGFDEYRKATTSGIERRLPGRLQTAVSIATLLILTAGLKSAQKRSKPGKGILFSMRKFCTLSRTGDRRRVIAGSQLLQRR